MPVSAEIRQLTDATFELMVRKSSGYVLVDFWASDCLPCDLIDPILHQIATDYAATMPVMGVHANVYTDIGRACGIMSAPTIVLFKDGVEVTRLPVSEIAQRIHASNPGEGLVPQFMAEVQTGIDTLLANLPP